MPSPTDRSTVDPAAQQDAQATDAGAAAQPATSAAEIKAAIASWGTHGGPDAQVESAANLYRICATRGAANLFVEIVQQTLGNSFMSKVLQQDVADVDEKKQWYIGEIQSLGGSAPGSVDPPRTPMKWLVNKYRELEATRGVEGDLETRAFVAAVDEALGARYSDLLLQALTGGPIPEDDRPTEYPTAHAPELLDPKGTLKTARDRMNPMGLHGAAEKARELIRDQTKVIPPIDVETTDADMYGDATAALDTWFADVDEVIYVIEGVCREIDEIAKAIGPKADRHDIAAAADARALAADLRQRAPRLALHVRRATPHEQLEGRDRATVRDETNGTDENRIGLEMPMQGPGPFRIEVKLHSRATAHADLDRNLAGAYVGAAVASGRPGGAVDMPEPADWHGPPPAPAPLPPAETHFWDFSSERLEGDPGEQEVVDPHDFATHASLERAKESDP